MKKQKAWYVIEKRVNGEWVLNGLSWDGKPILRSSKREASIVARRLRNSDSTKSLRVRQVRVLLVNGPKGVVWGDDS